MIYLNNATAKVFAQYELGDGSVRLG